MAIGLAPVFYWRRKHDVSWRVFGLGAIAWLSASVLKALMDGVLTPSLAGAVQGVSALTSAAFFGLYVGIRTGVCKTGFTWIWARRFKLSNASFDDAVGFGLGFACVESLALGLNSFLGILEILMNPAVLGTLDPAVQQALSAQYALGAAIIGPPIIDRLSNLFIDCFAIVMVFMAMRNVKGLFLIATVFASMADFMIPLLNVYVSGSTLAGVYILEAPYLLLGLIGLSGLLRSRSDPVFAAEPLRRGKPHAR
jgi:uncharacterized membrane protein YhfC